MSAHRSDARVRFEERHVTVPEAGCWIWIGRCKASGYGRIGIGRNRQFMAHRVSWELHRGPIPAGKYVCHKCDTPACVNPDHLFLGSAEDNAKDRESKARAAKNRNGGGWNRGIPHAVSHPNGSLGSRRKSQ